jgi:hypothetical protein
MLAKCEQFKFSFPYDCPKRPDGNKLQTFQPETGDSYVTKITSADSGVEAV